MGSSQEWIGNTLENDKGMEYLVVLDWRTPNNSIGILWNFHNEIEPLFPR